MASVRRVACALAAVSFVNDAAWAADTTTANIDSTLPSAYSLSYDKDQWTDEFSVFRMAVSDQMNTLGSGFAASDDPRLRPLTRLDSSWTVSTPLLASPLRLGDGVSSAGFWNDPARMGGLQFGSMVPVAPEVIAPPSIIATPYTQMGPAGLVSSSTQFIDHLRTLVQFQKQSLVAPGQAVYSIESGRLRENFEVRSNDYGPWITSGTYRYGVNGATTVDGEFAQVSGQQSFMGLGVLEGLGPLGMFSAKVASSRDADLTGWVARMGYDFTQDRLSIALRSHIQSINFQDVGDASVTESLRQRTLASARFDLGSLGRVSVASATQTYTDDSRRDIVALSHAIPLGGGGVISTAAAYSPGPLGSSAVLLSFTYPFDYFTAPVRPVSGAVNAALDRTIVDAFGQTRLPPSGALRPMTYADATANPTGR